MIDRHHMMWVPGGTFRMGSDAHYPEEAPTHPVEVDGFWMDRFQVTNRQFETFVSAIGYVTVAERPLDLADFPSAPRRTSSPARWCSGARQDPWTCAI